MQGVQLAFRGGTHLNAWDPEICSKCCSMRSGVMLPMFCTSPCAGGKGAARCAVQGRAGAVQTQLGGRRT